MLSFDGLDGVRFFDPDPSAFGVETFWKAIEDALIKIEGLGRK